MPLFTWKDKIAMFTYTRLLNLFPQFCFFMIICGCSAEGQTNKTENKSFLEIFTLLAWLNADYRVSKDT